MTVDDYGRVVLSPDEMIAMLYDGRELTPDLLGEAGDEVARYNQLCRENDKLEYLIPVSEPKDISADQEHENRKQIWFMPQSFIDIDVWSVLERRCKTDRDRARLAQERIEYEKRDLLPLLRMMMYLVEQFRDRKIVWGVGRGSSVASFTLYLIGITKINPLLYGLEIGEFLKD